MAPFLTSSGECEGTAGHQSTSQQEMGKKLNENQKYEHKSQKF